MSKFFRIIYILGAIGCSTVYGTEQLLIHWGTHFADDGTQSFLAGDEYSTGTTGFSSSKSDVLLKSLLGTGAVDGNLAEGDLVELGFFDTDLSASISPNTDSSNLFEGTWTALSSITKIGEDWDSSSDVGTGEFFFTSLFENDSNFESSEAAANLRVHHNADSGLGTIGSVNSYDILDGNEDPTTFNQDNLVDSRVNAIFTESVTNSNPVYLGIRFLRFFIQIFRHDQIQHHHEHKLDHRLD